MDTEIAPYPLMETPFNEVGAELSPDGRWLAYISDETGQPEVFVRAFPALGRRWQVSRDGAASVAPASPKWSSRGDELFYLDLHGTLMAVPVGLEDESFTHENASPLFQAHVGRPYFSVTEDGERFLVLERQPSTGASRIQLLLGWKLLLDNEG